MKLVYLTGPNAGKTFHLDSTGGQALIALGLAEEYREPKPALIPLTKWSVSTGAAGGLIVMARCSGCGASVDALAEDAIAHPEKVAYTHCGATESLKDFPHVLDEAKYRLKVDKTPPRAENLMPGEDPVLKAKRKEISDAIRRWTVRVLPSFDSSPIPWSQGR